MKPKSGSLQTHDNLSEGSWLVPWCLWEAGGRALLSWLCVLLIQGCGTGVDSNRTRPGGGTETEMESQGEASLVLRCPCRAAPAILLCLLSFPCLFTVFGHLNALFETRLLVRNKLLSCPPCVMIALLTLKRSIQLNSAFDLLIFCLYMYVGVGVCIYMVKSFLLF